ncbi:MAG: sulfatase [Gemmatimonadota bacterium]
MTSRSAVPITAAALLMLALITGCATESDDPSTATSAPNVVIIFLDDVGYGDLGAYGHPTIRTPNMDRMAAEGVKLTGFYAAAPSCSPSRAGLLTGRYPVRAGILWALGPEEENGIPAEEWTLAEALQESGYRTAAVGKWHLGSWPGLLPTEHGFDSFFGLLYSNDMIRPWVNTDRPLELYRDTESIEHPVDQATLTRRYTEESVRFIGSSASGDEPFFLYLAHSMAHVPLYRSPEFEGHSAGGKYGDVIEELDWSVGRVRQALEEAGVAENTFVFLTSDNGPWAEMPDRMFSEGHIQPWDAGTSGPLRGSKASTWEGGLRVPAIAWWPGRLPAGRSSPELGTVMDLFPTIANLAGSAAAPDRPFDGRDIMRWLEGVEPSPNELFFYVNPGVVRGVRDTRWKLLVRRPAPDSVLRAELYDLESDPYERFDVAAEHADVVERLRGEMTRFAEESGARLETND